MASRSEFGGEDGRRESSRSGEEPEEENVGYPSDEPKGKMSDYEKQRFSRIAENKARLEALGISTSKNAFLGSRKQNFGEEDDDYRPGEADGDDEDEEFLENSSSVFSRKAKAKPLSLQDSATAPSMKRRNDQEAGSWKKKKPELKSKLQMTEDELIIYFFQLDERGKGFITLRDVAKMATVHDFTWTEEELRDMIRCFDMDKDGKLSLDEFRNIVTRCRMLKESC